MVAVRERFRNILARRACVPAAPVFDPLSARVAEVQGWEVCKLSGSVGKFANLGVPDGIPLSNMSDLADICSRINKAVDMCMIVDADEGGGNALTVRRTVQDLEAAGVCAIELEDNLVPSRFPQPGSNARRHSEMIPAAEQVGKLRAAVAARRDPATMIVARTSALDEFALPEALDRIRAYSDTGVEALMLPNVPNGRADIEAVSKVTRLPLFVLRLPPDAAADTAWLAAHNILIRYVGLAPYAMAVKAIYDGLLHLKEGGTPDGLKDRLASPEILRAVDRTEEFREWQRDYLKD
jgi:oxaloacetate decarboxylase